MNQIPTTLADGFWHWLWFENPSKNAAGVARIGDSLFMYIFWLSVAWFVFLMGLTFYFVVRYRRMPGRKLTRSPAHHTPLEIAWTVVPTLFLVYIFFKGFWGYADALVAPANAEQITLTAQKWDWRFTYPNGAESPLKQKFTFTDEDGRMKTTFKEVPIFVVPAGKPVQLRMNSIDVIHAFWVPDFRSKFDVFPNRYTAYWFQADEPGDHLIYCAEYCGDLHSEMAGVLRVVPEAEYHKTINEWNTAGLTLPQLGAFLYKSKGCNSCHSVDGTKNTGPTWKDMFGHEVELEGGGKVTADENYIRESILVPGTKIVKGYPNQMTPYQGQLNERELSGLIAYMQELAGITLTTPPADGAAPAEGTPPTTPEGH